MKSPTERDTRTVRTDTTSRSGGRADRPREREATEEGSSTVQAFLLLLALSALALGFIAVLSAGFGLLSRAEAASARRGKLLDALASLTALIESDSTPEGDSPIDEVWSTVSAGAIDGVRIVEFSDVSSAVCPNWAQKALFEKTGLGSLFLAGKSAAILQQYRIDEGFGTDLKAHYADFFTDAAYDDGLLTGYALANVNTTDEFALRSIAEIRTGDSSRADAFHNKVRQALMNRRIVTRDDFQDFMGTDFEALFPVVCAEPQMNVHFLPPRILEELLSYPDYEVESPAAKAAFFESERTVKELAEADIRAVVAVEEPNRIYAYLGVVTWFWRAELELEGERLTAVIAREPNRDPTDTAKRVSVVEKRFGS